MAKDYFQDIVPPEEDAPRPSKAQNTKSIPIKTTAPAAESVAREDTLNTSDRSIRNINVPERPMRTSRPSVDPAPRPQQFSGGLPPKPIRPKTSRTWLWVGLVAFIVLIAGAAVFFLRKTTVTVTPRSHVVVFDQNSDFTAYPASSGATSSALLMYSTVSSDLQESEVVPASGSQHVETKAQGNITVYNDYSSSAVKLIANTRFQSPTGLIFRTPNDIVVPGKVGSTPGKVSVTVFADQAGDQYNLGPTSRFTVPGLQSTPAMYSNIYAQSSASTTGGFIGDQPAADPAAVQNAITDLRSKLQADAQSAANADQNASTIVFPELMQVTYQDLPQTSEAGGGARINEQAHIVIPEFNAQSFSQAIASNVSADAQGSTLYFVPGEGFSANLAQSASTTLGTDPITFALFGNATLVWQVDTNALTAALAGKSDSAFNTIVSGFPSIQEAKARIEPFWNSTFPQNAADIQVVVQPPASQ